jgi:hypothetical protein
MKIDRITFDSLIDRDFDFLLEGSLYFPLDFSNALSALILISQVVEVRKDIKDIGSSITPREIYLVDGLLFRRRGKFTPN